MGFIGYNNRFYTSNLHINTYGHMQPITSISFCLVMTTYFMKPKPNYKNQNMQRSESYLLQQIDDANNSLVVILGKTNSNSVVASNVLYPKP